VSKASLDLTLEFINLIDAAKSPSEVASIILKCVAPYGFENVFAGTMPAVADNSAQQRNHVILDDWPRPWLDRYFSRGYLHVDPTIRRVRAGGSPFYWTELGDLDDRAATVMGEAAEFGLVGGLTVPLVSLDGETAGFSIAGASVEYNPLFKGMMMLLATYAMGRCFGFDVLRLGDRRPLTHREASILRWIAEGKTDWEIGEILSLSEHTVDKHVRNILAKLRATNRTAAVAKAMRAKTIF
jgi:LuxR family transcriptional regulator, quorum-sensing system regulator BjaR1